MTLLDEALAAHGGGEAWASARQVTPRGAPGPVLVRLEVDRVSVSRD